jgi:hypothetical protein
VMDPLWPYAASAAKRRHASTVRQRIASLRRDTSFTSISRFIINTPLSFFSSPVFDAVEEPPGCTSPVADPSMEKAELSSIDLVDLNWAWEARDWD